jgi:hypothetical protein
MKHCFAVGALALAALVAYGQTGGEALKSGPVVGKNLTPFNPLHCNGPDVGTKVCLV